MDATRGAQGAPGPEIPLPGSGPMHGPATQITVVVPAYNEADRLPRTLHDLVRFAAADGRRFEIIVVDDGSVDATSAMVAGFGRDNPEVRLIRLPRNRGKGH